MCSLISSNINTQFDFFNLPSCKTKKKFIKNSQNTESKPLELKEIETEPLETLKKKLNFAEILKNSDEKSFYPKEISDVKMIPSMHPFEEIEVEKFYTWLEKNHPPLQKESWMNTKTYSELQNFTYAKKIKNWYEKPDWCLNQLQYTFKEVELKRWAVFIHTLPQLFDRMVGSNFTCFTDKKKQDSYYSFDKNNSYFQTKKENKESTSKTSDSNDNLAPVYQFISVVQVIQKGQVIGNLAYPEKNSIGWLVYSIGSENNVCFHKCYAEKTLQHKDGDAQYHDWDHLIPKIDHLFKKFQEQKEIEAIRSIADQDREKIEIYYSKMSKVLNFFTPDKTIYRFAKID